MVSVLSMCSTRYLLVARPAQADVVQLVLLFVDRLERRGAQHMPEQLSDRLVTASSVVRNRVLLSAAHAAR